MLGNFIKGLFGQKEDVQQPVAVVKVKKDIYNTTIGDLITFGHNDLTELIDETFTITGRFILENDRHKMIFLKASGRPQLPKIYIDITTNEDHITIYKEVSPDDVFSCLAEGDSPESEFASHLIHDVEDNGSFQFSQDKTQEEMDKYWFNKKRYYVRKNGEYLFLETNKDVLKAEGNNVEDCQLNWFESDQREFNFITLLREGTGATTLYAGRRIEPYDISSIDSPE